MNQFTPLFGLLAGRAGDHLDPSVEPHPCGGLLPHLTYFVYRSF